MTALKGIKVLDMAMGIAGPHAGMLCAEHGADVVKVESIKGDWARTLGGARGDLTAYSALYNRGKRSIAIDAKDPESLALLQATACESDVLIEAFRPGVMKRMGMDYETLKKKNPKLIYVSVSGFGQVGPMVDRPATDAVLQAFTGFMNLNKTRDGLPRRVDMILIDVVTGMYGFQAIATALLERNGGAKEGKYVDCSLMKCAIAFLAPKMIDNYLQGGVQTLYVPLGVLPTADGHVSISVMHDHHFVAMCHALDRPDAAATPAFATRQSRLEHEAEVMDMLNAEFRKHSTEELSRRLTQAGVLHAKVNSFAELLAHEQVAEVSAVTWTKQDGIADPLPIPNIPGARPARHEREAQAPHLGEHSAKILRDWGVAESKVDDLIARGVVKQYRKHGAASASPPSRG